MHSKYYNNKGEEVPSVTTIIGRHSSAPYLVTWANNLGLKGIKNTEETNKACVTGTLTHSFIENFLINRDFNEEEVIEKVLTEENIDSDLYFSVLVPEAKKAFRNFLRYFSENKLEPVELELKLSSSSYNFGGTIDFYGKLNKQFIVADFKTAKSIQGKNFIQLAAYATLLKENGYIDVEKAVVIRVDKQKDVFNVKEVGIEELRQYWQVFRLYLELEKHNKVLKFI